MKVIKKKCLGITLGDPLGIGPEIVAKTLNYLSKINANVCFKVIGSNSAFNKACQISNINSNLKNIEEFINFDERIVFNN